MTACITIITHLTEKKIVLTDTYGNIVNETYSNECIIAPYQSYIVYMSNPIEITSFTTLINSLDTVLGQFLMAAFAVIIATVFYIFLMVVKKKGFKGV